MPRKPRAQPIRDFGSALRRAQARPDGALVNVARPTLMTMVKRGLAMPTPHGSGWQLTERGRAYQSGER